MLIEGAGTGTFNFSEHCLGDWGREAPRYTISRVSHLDYHASKSRLRLPPSCSAGLNQAPVIKRITPFPPLIGNGSSETAFLKDLN